MEIEATFSGRILIADDEETFREASITLLQRAGYEVVGATAGAEALERLRKGSFDLLISDIRMPGNEELELIRSVTEVVPGLPIILVTGFPSVNTAIWAVQLPVAAYLVKPVDPEELNRIVQRVVAQRHAFQAVENNLKRLDSWHRDLRTIMAGLKPKQAEVLNHALGAFLTLSLRHITGTLSDMRSVIDFMLTNDPSNEAIRALEASHPIALTAALQDTIATLEGTKASFKSRALGELRERLEILLGETQGHTPTIRRQRP